MRNRVANSLHLELRRPGRSGGAHSGGRRAPIAQSGCWNAVITGITGGSIIVPVTHSVTRAMCPRRRTMVPPVG
eukprot:6817669-Prymnesium_polylepis.1